MPAKWYETEVVSIKVLTPHVKEFTLSTPDDVDFDFLPGQFITMDLPVGEKRLDRWRSYSIANAPEEKNVLVFCIVRFQDGRGSCYFHDTVRVGDKIKWKGPDGAFVLPEKINGPVIMMATGTGIAPFRSMIHHLIAEKQTFPSIHLLFGTRKEEDILYRQEFELFAHDIPAFRYDVALSRENISGFYHGYIHEIYLPDSYTISENTTIYLCGWSQMIDQAVEWLQSKKQVRKEQIKFELYG